MRHSYRSDIQPKPQPYHPQILDHLGLVAGMFEELGITEVIDQATQQDPEMRLVTAGHALKAMVLNGMGFINQQIYLVPHFFQNKPISRLIAPGIQASHLNDDTLGRTLDTLYDYGVTELYSLIAATARPPPPSAWALPPPVPISIRRVSMSMAGITAMRPLTHRSYTSPKVIVGIIAPTATTRCWSLSSST